MHTAIVKSGLALMAFLQLLGAVSYVKQEDPDPRTAFWCVVLAVFLCYVAATYGG